jgi:hypothetical protein
VALNPHLQLLNAPPELQLDRLKLPEFSPEKEASGGAYKTEDLLRWAEENTWRVSRRITRQHVGRFDKSILSGGVYRDGHSPQEFASYLQRIQDEATGALSPWAWFIEVLYQDLMLAGNICSIIVCCGVIGSACFGGVRFILAAKERALKTTAGALFRAFCCGVSSMMMDTQYTSVFAPGDLPKAPNEGIDTVGRLEDIRIEAPRPSDAWMRPAIRTRALEHL